MYNRQIIAILTAGAAALLVTQSPAQSLAQPASPPPPVVPILPQQPGPTGVVHAPPPPVQASYVDLPASVLTWDTLDQAVTVEAGTPMAHFSFNFTNVSETVVTVASVRTSCGCTTAQLPAMPWLIPPGSNEVLNINMNLAGKRDTVIKSVSFSTDKGTKNLLVRTTILPLESTAGMTPGARQQNQMLASADRQAVFKGDCASCHLEPARGKMGADLYTAACGVCHEAEHRATMVPDLKVAKQERNEEFWRNWITNGKQGSLMPAFAASQGGFLTDQQITSLVEHLMKALPTKPTPHTAASVPPPAH